MESMSLFDRKYTGGLHGHGGYDFEDSYVLSQLPNWLTLADLVSFQQELLTDLELFFGSGSRWFIQIKKRPLRKNEFLKIIQSFQEREGTSSDEYEKYIIASPGLSPSIQSLSGRLERFRSAKNYSEPELANSRKELTADLESLKCDSHAELIIDKVFFDSAIEWVKNEEVLQGTFTSSLVREHCIKPEDAENIYLRTARLLVVERGKPIRLSLFEAALKQKRLEADTQSLSDFDLITPEFLQSRTDDSVSYFYDGTIPTWSDIIHLRDIPRDIMPEILNRVDQVDHGRVLVPILAEAGEGKSTFLHRMAAELAGRHKTVLCRRRDRITIRAEEIRSVAEMADQCVYVFVDDAARAQNLKGFIESVAALPYPIVLVVASRPYEWVPFRSVYGANLLVEFHTDSREWSLEGATDREIELLFRRLAEAELINSLTDEELRSLIDSYSERSKRKLLVLVLELTKGKRVTEIIRDECERVRQMGDSVLQVYRYVCLMGSVHSFITRSILNKLVKTECVDLDIVGRLPGLVEAIGENIYARHDRIGEIAADILFHEADAQRGDALCEIITLALKGAQSDVVRSMIRGLYGSVPESQRLRVVSYLVREAYLAGEIGIVGEVFANQPSDSANKLIFDEVLAANVPIILDRLISPSLRKAIRSPRKEIENLYTYPSFSLSPTICRENLGCAGGDSLQNDLGWTEVFAEAARYSDWASKHRESFTSITDKLYDGLTRIRLGGRAEIRFHYAEFLRETSREKDAIPLYKCVIEWNPDHAKAHAALAVCFYFDGNYKAGLHHYKIARQLDWQAIHGYGHEDIFEELLQRLGDWDELILLLKANSKTRVDINRRFRQSDIGQKMLLELKLIKHPAKHEIDMLRVFDDDPGEEDLLVHVAKLDGLLQYVKTLPTNKQDELGKSIFKRPWFGELRRQ